MAISERKFKEQPNKISLAVATEPFSRGTLRSRDWIREVVALLLGIR